MPKTHPDILNDPGHAEIRETDRTIRPSQKIDIGTQRIDPGSLSSSSRRATFEATRKQFFESSSSSHRFEVNYTRHDPDYTMPVLQKHQSRTLTLSGKSADTVLQHHVQCFSRPKPFSSLEAARQHTFFPQRQPMVTAKTIASVLRHSKISATDGSNRSFECVVSNNNVGDPHLEQHGMCYRLKVDGKGTITDLRPHPKRHMDGYERWTKPSGRFPDGKTPNASDFFAGKRMCPIKGLPSSEAQLVHRRTIAMRGHTINAVKQGVAEAFGVRQRGGSGQIGGVGVKSGRITGLKNSLARLLESEIKIILQRDDAKKRISDTELQQMIREVYYGVVVEDVDFAFSLHFNTDGSICPVIDPVYEHTSVGRSGAFIDYYIKSYLIGSCYHEDYLASLAVGQKPDPSKVVDLQKYCQEHLGEEGEYKSLHELIAEAGIKQFEETAAGEKTKRRFQISFRLMFNQPPVKKAEDTFALDKDKSFEAKWTIHPCDGFSEEQDPAEYAKLVEVCKQTARQIEETMPRLPICKKYFEKLRLTTFLTSLFRTFKAMQLIPDLADIPLARPVGVPKLFPTSPVREYETFKVEVDINTIYSGLSWQTTDALNDYCHKKISGEIACLDETILRELHAKMREELKRQTKVKPLECIVKELTENLLQACITNAQKVKQDELAQAEETSRKMREEFSHRFPALHKLLTEKPAEPTKQTGYHYCSQLPPRSYRDAMRKELTRRFPDLQEILRESRERPEKQTSRYPSSAAALACIKSWDESKSVHENSIDIARKEAIKDEEKKLQDDLAEINRQKFAELRKKGAGALAELKQEEEDVLREIKTISNTSDRPYYQAWGDHHDRVRKQTKPLYSRLYDIHGQISREESYYCPQTLQAIAACEAKIETAKQQCRKQHQLTKEFLSENPENFAEALRRKIEKKFRMPLEMEMMFGSHSGTNKPITGFTLQTSIKSSVLKPLATSRDSQSGEQSMLMGGCRIVIKDQPLVFEPTVHTTLDRSFTAITEAAPETFVPVIHDGKPSYAFRLPIRASSAVSKEDYILTTPPAHYKAESSINPEEAMLFDAIAEKDLTEITRILQDEQLRKKIHRDPDQGQYRVAKNHLLQTLMYVAACSDNPLITALLIDHSLFTNIPDIDGYTPSHVAAFNGNVAMLEQFYRQDLSANGSNPSYLAAQEGKLDALRFLIQYGARVHCVINNSISTLYVAIFNDHTDCALYLIDHYRLQDINHTLDDGSTALLLAAELGHEEVVVKLLEKGANQKLKRLDGLSPIHVAVEKGHLKIIEMLLRYDRTNTIVDAQPGSGLAPIFYAIIEGNLAVVKLLIRYRADLNLRNASKETPLMVAIRNGQTEIAKLLIKKAMLILVAESRQEKIAFLDTVNKQDETALMIAAQLGFFDVAEKLIAHGANKDFCDSHGWSYIHYLAKFGRHDLIKSRLRSSTALREQTLKQTIQNTKITALQIAAKSGQAKVVSILTKAGATDFTDSTNNYKLINYAAQHDFYDVVKKWLDGGKIFKSSELALAARSCKKTKTLAYLAAENGSVETLELLLTRFPLERAFCDRHLLFGAVESGSQKAVDLVLAKMDDWNVPLDATGTRAVHIAAAQGNIEMLHFLSEERGYDITVADDNGLTCFHFAIANEMDIVEEYLLDEKYDFTLPQDILHFCALHGTPEQLTRLLNRGLSVNQLHPETKETPLFNAIRKGDIYIESVAFLCQKGANVKDVVSAAGLTPAALAAKLGEHEIYRFLIANGAKEIEGYRDEARPTSDEEKLFAYLMSGDDANFIALFKHYCSHDPSQINRHFRVSLKVGSATAHAEFSLLYWALRLERVDLAKFLLQNGADINATNKPGMAPIHAIAETGNLELLELAKSYKVDLTAQDKNSCNALHYAAKSDDPTMACIFVGEGLDIESTSKQGETALIVAVQANKPEMVAELITSGANIDHLSNQMVSALYIAATKGYPKIVDILLEKGANPNKTCTTERNTCLHAAIRKKHFKVAFALIAAGARIDIPDKRGVTPAHIAATVGCIPLLSLFSEHDKDSLKQITDAGDTVLHCAALAKNPKVVAFVANKLGGNVNQQTEAKETLRTKTREILDGRAPVHIAAAKGDKATTKLLLDKLKADPNVVDECGQGLMVHATHSGDLELLKFLEKYGLHEDTEQATKAMMQATANAYIKIMEYYLQLGVSVDARLTAGLSLLHMACIHHKSEAVHFLLSRGADPEAIMGDGTKPIHFAVRNGDISSAQALLDMGVDINKPDAEGKSLLHLACEANHEAMVMLLISYEANINAKDGNGHTPLLCATTLGHEKIVRLLMGCKAEGADEAFEKACEAGREACAKVISSYSECYKKEGDPDSPLQAAVRLSDHDTARSLTWLGKEGQTPIEVQPGDEKMARALFTSRQAVAMRA
jgi:ankyrin repeat protein